MTSSTEFLKAAPGDFQVHERPDPQQSYKYFLRGKDCTLGVLFESSVNIYFEWLCEKGQMVEYGPDIRYKWWPKHEFARLINAGVWDIVGSSEVPA